MKQKKKKIRMAALITVLSVLVLFFAVFLLFQTRKIEEMCIRDSGRPDRACGRQNAGDQYGL